MDLASCQVQWSSCSCVVDVVDGSKGCCLVGEESRKKTAPAPRGLRSHSIQIFKFIPERKEKIAQGQSTVHDCSMPTRHASLALWKERKKKSKKMAR